MTNFKIRLLFLIVPLCCVFPQSNATPYITVLGIAQDAGYPQAECIKDCCKRAWASHEARRMVSCLGIVDPISNEYWLIDATPDIKFQMQSIVRAAKEFTVEPIILGGVFLTHAHIGHYTGLMQFGHEVMGASNIKVYAMPVMQQFLSQNGPWEQLVTLNNIQFCELKSDSAIVLNERIKVTPFRVPHRDEYSETVGYKIGGPDRQIIFIPDIDKWEKWGRNIDDLIANADYAFLDGTFFENGEIPGRDMSLIPHPFIEESMARFSKLPISERQKIHFIHLNHTNPALDETSKAYRKITDGGYHVAVEGQIVEL